MRFGAVLFRWKCGSVSPCGAKKRRALQGEERRACRVKKGEVAAQKNRNFIRQEEGDLAT